MCLANNETSSVKPSRYARIAPLMPSVEIRRYSVGHFDVYLGNLWDEISSAQTEFLHRPGESAGSDAGNVNELADHRGDRHREAAADDHLLRGAG